MDRSLACFDPVPPRGVGEGACYRVLRHGPGVFQRNTLNNIETGCGPRSGSVKDGATRDGIADRLRDFELNSLTFERTSGEDVEVMAKFRQVEEGARTKP